MFQSDTNTMRRIFTVVPRFAFVALWQLMTAATTLQAAEQPANPLHEARLDTARGFQSLTAGGLFNPAAASPFIP